MLLIVRHAHRDRDEGREVDNGLSGKGREQARALVKALGKRLSGAADGTAMTIRLLSSPKARCRETLAPLARALDRQVEVEPLLDEGEGVDRRTREVVERWRAAAGEAWVLCSHGDVIPVLVDRLLGISVELKKAGWARIERGEGGRLRLVELIQKP